MMKRILILLGLAMPVVAAADMGVPPNAMDAAVDFYSMTSKLKQYVGREFSGELLTQLCEIIKEYLKSWDMTIEINPGQNWVDVIDCNKNKTDAERVHLWQACMFAAKGIYTQGKMRTDIVAQAVLNVCKPSGARLGADITCQFGGVNRCLVLGVDEATGNRLASCCVVAPELVNGINVQQQGDISSALINYPKQKILKKHVYKILDKEMLTLSDFDENCEYRE